MRIGFRDKYRSGILKPVVERIGSEQGITVSGDLNTCDIVVAHSTQADVEFVIRTAAHGSILRVSSVGFPSGTPVPRELSQNSFLFHLRPPISGIDGNDLVSLLWDIGREPRALIHPSTKRERMKSLFIRENKLVLCGCLAVLCQCYCILAVKTLGTVGISNKTMHRIETSGIEEAAGIISFTIDSWQRLNTLDWWLETCGYKSRHDLTAAINFETDSDFRVRMALRKLLGFFQAESSNHYPRTHSIELCEVLLTELSRVLSDA